MKKSISMILVLSMLISMFMGIMTFSAGAKETTPAGNIWYGDEISVDVTAGKDGYTFLSAYVKPRHTYEMSGHMISVDGGVSNDIPQTLVMIDASKDYTWTPNGLYTPGASNYEVLYCCDAETGYENGIYYKRMNLEDSDYYDADEAAHIRSIATNSYPFISLDEMKKNLAEGGFEGAEELTRAEIISAVQAAIWAYANKDVGMYVYSKTFDVPSNSQWGGHLHNFNPESDIWWNTGKRKFSYDENVENRINSLIEYLKNLEAVAPTGIVISNLEIVDFAPVQEKDGVYTVALRVTLNSSASDLDTVKLDICVDDAVSTSQSINVGANTYDITVEAKAGQTISATVSGTQFLPRDVYFYEPEGGRHVSQCLVGVASGATNIYSQASVSLDVPNESTDTFDLNLKKIDEKGNSVAGAGFSLYISTNKADLFVGNYTVDAQGVLNIENLLPGKYILAETVTPEGYEPLEGSIGFTVSENGQLVKSSLPAGVSIVEGNGTIALEVVNVKVRSAINGIKYLNGKPASGFEFALMQGDKTVATAKSGKDGRFSFVIELDKAGKYEYTVVEIAGKNENIIYDDSVFNVTVTVDENAEVTVEYDSQIVFNNITVSPASVVIDGEKYLDGKPADGFLFVLADEDGNEIETVQSENGIFSFSELEFDSEGIYTYFVSEIAGDNDKIIYDDTVFEVGVTVTKAGETYLASLSIKRAEKIAFYNKTTIGTSYIFEGEKYLDGVPAAGYEFAIMDGEEILSTAISDENGKFYLVLDCPIVGDYTYNIVEIAGDDETIIYDDTVYEVNVEVVIEGDTLVATADEVQIVFNNQKVKPAVVNFTGSNYLDLVLTGGFNFALKDGDEIIATATSDENGFFTLPSLYFNRNGRYIYTFVEIAGDIDTIVYDESVYTLIIDVTLKGNELVADVTVNYLDKSNPFKNARSSAANSLDISGLDFYNWTIRTGTQLEGVKYLDGKAAAGFEFALLDSNGNVIATTTSDENGIFSFNLDCTATGTFNYSVVEIAGNDESIIYDASVIGVTVEVVREGIELKAIITTDSEVVFNNTTVTTEPEEEITEPEEEITEPDVPLAPATGDNALLIVLTAVAALALGVVYFKRRETTEE